MIKFNIKNIPEAVLILLQNASESQLFFVGLSITVLLNATSFAQKHGLLKYSGPHSLVIISKQSQKVHLTPEENKAEFTLSFW